MAILVSHPPPCLIHEDDHLLVVNKPAGWNTHMPAPFAGEGIYDWLRQREPRWATLAIIHRLDKETSGLLLFGKSAAANRSLTGQFTNRRVKKRYFLLTDRAVPEREFTVESSLVRLGEKYVSRSKTGGDEKAITRFRWLEENNGIAMLEASPLTGRTHQIRVHAAEKGFPILGDTLYGGSPFSRVCLHAGGIEFEHPATGENLAFSTPADFEEPIGLALRRAFIREDETNSCRMIHGASDHCPGIYAERLGDFFLTQSETEPDPATTTSIKEICQALKLRGAYHKPHTRHTRGRSTTESSPRHWFGEAAPDSFLIRENGVSFRASFNEGYSYGLFLDQRDNRRRLLSNHVAAGFAVADGGLPGREVLNTFAYTCGFSVCAALAGARATSLDLSKKYLDWGRQNFAENRLDAGQHDFIFGDVFDWMRRLTKKNRLFDVVILDPPTFSQSKVSGMFRAEQDYGTLVEKALPLIKPGGTLLASTNASLLEPERFLETVRGAITRGKRKLLKEFYAPQPPDFPITRNEPGHLKSAWFKLM